VSSEDPGQSLSQLDLRSPTLQAPCGIVKLEHHSSLPPNRPYIQTILSFALVVSLSEVSILPKEKKNRMCILTLTNYSLCRCWRPDMQPCVSSCTEPPTVKQMTCPNCDAIVGTFRDDLDHQEVDEREASQGRAAMQAAGSRTQGRSSFSDFNIPGEAPGICNIAPPLVYRD